MGGPRGVGNIVVDPVIGKGRIHMFVHHIENDGDSARMSGIDKAFQPVRSVEMGTRRKVINRTVSPVEIELVRGDRSLCRSARGRVQGVSRARLWPFAWHRSFLTEREFL